MPKRRQILVFTEGSRTEVIYLTAWRRRHRETCLVTVDESHGVPFTLVRAAIERMKTDRREELHGRGVAFDEYWCVFDVDEHPDLPGALEEAREAGISVALSNPNVELWFLLHFEAQTAEIHRSDATRRAQAHLRCGKSLTPQACQSLLDQYSIARERALSLEQRHETNDMDRRSNPSSGMYALIDEIMGVNETPAGEP